MLKRIFFLASFILAPTFAEEYHGHHIGINAGLSTTKNFLGGFYSWDRNQINAGTNLTIFSFEEGIFYAQPSITYNRYLTANGLYASLGMMATYYPETYETYTPPTPPEAHGTYTQHNEPSWRTNYLTLGLGKNFQYRYWGFNIDGNLTAPLDTDFGNTFGLWLGAGLSYRFKLN